MKMIESEKINKYLDLARELKKAGAHEGVSDNNCSWYAWKLRRIKEKRLKELEIRGDLRASKSWHCANTKTNPRNLRRLAIP